MKPKRDKIKPLVGVKMKNLFETYVVNADTMTVGSIAVIALIVVSFFGYIIVKAATFKVK